MVKAKTSKKVMADILVRISAFVVYLSDKIFSFYGARWDSALSFEDIQSFVTISMMTAIKKYNPKKYDPKKDLTKKKAYLDGFSYLCTIGRRTVKDYYRYHHRKKRIPLEKLVSLDQIIDDSGNDLLSILHEGKSLMENNFRTQQIKNMFRDKYIKCNGRRKIHLYNIVKLLLDKNMTYIQIGKRYHISRQRIGKIIKDHIVKKLKGETDAI